MKSCKKCLYVDANIVFDAPCKNCNGFSEYVKAKKIRETKVRKAIAEIRKKQWYIDVESANIVIDIIKRHTGIGEK